MDNILKKENLKKINKHTWMYNNELAIIHTRYYINNIGDVFSQFGTPLLPIGWYKHTSVSAQFRDPTWEELKAVKEIFHDDRFVFQPFRPSDHQINLIPHCIHIYEPTGKVKYTSKKDKE